jgi:hypothetical protein
MAKVVTTKRFLMGLVAAATMALAPVLASADTLTAIGVDCGDGSPISATVDSATVLKVQGALQAMIDYPADLSCSLTTSTVDPTLSLGTTTTTSATMTTPTTDPDGFATGGGRYFSPFWNCVINFALSAHPDKDEPGTAHGISNATNPGNCPSGPGHFSSKVLCITLTGNNAQIQSQITRADGSYYNVGFRQGDFVQTDVTDGANGNPDMIVHTWQSPSSGVCTQPATGGTHPLTNGNIKVDNDSSN